MWEGECKPNRYLCKFHVNEYVWNTRWFLQWIIHCHVVGYDCLFLELEFLECLCIEGFGTCSCDFN